MVDGLDPSEEGLASEASTTVLGDDRPATWRELELPRGSQIGRYVVLSRLGAGAMGVVVAAYDPELDRKVALKLLHPREDRRADVGRQRLLAEAQALARLSDPNVVTVHDVGLHEGRVFVAMEFVAGQTLEAWLAAAPRPWPAVLDVMTRAGRGLAAAHARELVHRDFKPANVMIGDDGRVLVMDFGLARAETDTGVGHDLDDEVVDVTGSRRRALGLELTQRGALVGTPAYMAPEQLMTGRGGPAADQFSFCTSLWEGLYGQRPFVDDTLPGLQARILMGQIDKPPSGRRVPRWLRRVVERGLEVDAAKRWPSMQALVSALEHGRGRARRQRGLAALGALVLAGAGVVGWQRWDEHRRVRACEHAARAEFAAAWDEDTAAAMREAMLATGLARAEIAATKVRPWLDAYAQDWLAARTEVCLHAEVRGTWDPDTADRGAWCLEVRRVELASVVEALTGGDARIVNMGVSMAAGLDRVEPCLDVQTLGRLPTPSTDAREAVHAVQAELARAGVALQYGRHEEALELGRAASRAAGQLGWPPLVASAHYREGQSLQRLGKFSEAERVLERAYFEALRADALETAVSAASRLVFLVGYDLARGDDGLRWAEHEDVLLLRLPDPLGVYAIQHLHGVSAIHYAAGEFDQVIALQQRLGPLQERAWGPDHPYVANGLNNFGNAYYQLGRYDEAYALYERAYVIEQESLGPEHPWIADKLDNLGLVAAAQGKHREALALHERALAIREASVRPDHPTVATTLNNLAIDHESLGDYDAAIAMHTRARAIWEAELGPEHPDVALSLHNLGVTHGLAGRLDQARALHERALALFEASVGPDHPNVALALRSLASIAIDQGRADEAVSLAERALRLREAEGAGPVLVAPIRFLLAQALWEQGRDRTRALALGRRALTEHRERGEAGAKDAAEVETWLAERARAEEPSSVAQDAQAPGPPPEPR